MLSKVILAIFAGLLLLFLFASIEHSYHEQKKKNKLREVKRWPLD
jgi:hypothetical protein